MGSILQMDRVKKIWLANSGNQLIVIGNYPKLF